MKRICRHPALLLILMLFHVLSAIPAYAHANLAQSQPPANAALETAPAEIRLWFTEPLEPRFSRITLRDAAGSRVELPAAQVDANDARQLFVPVQTLPHGVYTITWRVVSAADGHTTEGSIPFSVGAAVEPGSAPAALIESAPVDGVFIRWFNLFSMALLIGAVGFRLFAWQPVISDALPSADQRMRSLIITGWLLVGIAGIALLLYSTAQSAEVSLLAALTDPALGAVIAETRFGTLWLVRMGIWATMGVVLLTRIETWLSNGLIVAASMALLLTHSFYSHASAAQDATAAIAGDWLHVLATALWVGGLVTFAAVLPHVRQTERVGRLTASFSNYVRVCVAALIISGVYAAWLHVGSFEALLTTLYGRALLVKLILFVPLLVIAGINLLWTARGLRAERAIWVGRLRGLIAAEIALTLAILMAVGVMTATNPAREVLAVRNAAPPSAVNAQAPYFEMQTSPDVMAHLEFTPGFAGENTFIVTLFNLEDGSTIDDASLIRLRFDNEAGGYAQSELRPEPQGNGVYTVNGANLSAPGTWRVRMTIQRPGQFDTVLDFAPTVALPPSPEAPILDTAIPQIARLTASLLTGSALIAGGAFFLVTVQPRWRSHASLLTVTLIAIGGIFLLSAAVNTA